MRTEIYKQLTTNNLEIDFIEVKLTQRTPTTPKLYQGVGSVYQTDNGELELKLYYRYRDDSPPLRALNTNKHVQVGKIISDERYFDLVAKDMSGNIWTAERVYLSDTSFSFPSVGKIIKIQLESIKSVQKHEKFDTLKGLSSAIFIIPGTYNVPFNKYTDHKTGSTLNKLEFGTCQPVLHQFFKN